MTGNKYYKKAFFLLLTLAIAGSGYAQKLRLNGYGSYVFDGAYHIYYKDGSLYEGNIHHGLQFGLGMEYLLTPEYGVEFTSLVRNTNIFPEGSSINDTKSTELKFNSFLLGFNVYPQAGIGKLEAYGGVSAGVVVQTALSMVNSPDVMNRSITKFAWTAKLGGIFWLSDQVGLRLQTQWLSALQFKDAAVNFDVHRPGMVPAESSIANQLEIGSGFIIKIGKASDRN